MRALREVDAQRGCGISIRERKGITDDEMNAALNAGYRLMDAGNHQAAAEVFSGLLLYDPLFYATWQALEDLFRRERCPGIANVFAELARTTAV